jgi:septum formation protein
MNIGDASFWKQQKRTRQQRRHSFIAVNLYILVIFLLQFDKIRSFRAATKSVSAARQRFTAAGCDRIILGESRNRNRINTSCSSNRLFSTNTKTMATKNDGEDAPNPLARLGLPEPLLLGSASFTRKLILKEMGVPFSKFVRPIDEKALGDRSENAPPRELVLMLGNAKMDRLVQELKENDSPDDLPEITNETNNKGGWVVLTGDQVVTCDGKILEKPESVEEAKEMVERYAKSPPSTVGSVVLYHHPSGIRVDGVDTATIHFNSETLGNTDDTGASGSSTLINALIEAGEPVMSCAGGLMIEHPLTQHHVDRIEGTEDSVMGLSKDLVLRLLQELARKLP